MEKYKTKASAFEDKINSFSIELDEEMENFKDFFEWLT